jgi:septal ring factor EnvC (AmiA/AmiB activator)
MSATSPNNHDPERLNQIEESIGYLEVDGSRAREQFDELSKAMHELSTRMQRLESRIIDLNNRLETPDPGLVAPPHSAGPDITRDPL